MTCAGTLGNLRAKRLSVANLSGTGQSKIKNHNGVRSEENLIGLGLLRSPKDACPKGLARLL